MILTDLRFVSGQATLKHQEPTEYEITDFFAASKMQEEIWALRQKMKGPKMGVIHRPNKNWMVLCTKLLRNKDIGVKTKFSLVWSAWSHFYNEIVD